MVLEGGGEWITSGSAVSVSVLDSLLTSGLQAARRNAVMIIKIDTIGWIFIRSSLNETIQ